MLCKILNDYLKYVWVYISVRARMKVFCKIKVWSEKNLVNDYKQNLSLQIRLINKKNGHSVDYEGNVILNNPANLEKRHMKRKKITEAITCNTSSWESSCSRELVVLDLSEFLTRTQARNIAENIKEKEFLY